jgi:mannose-6-phosphate isomerase-like protein (cupin superfamily)
MKKINLAEKFAGFTEHWSPKIVAELNGQHVKLVKFRGPFVWHHHEHEDELFLVVRGSFRMEFKEPVRSLLRKSKLSLGRRRKGGVQFRDCVVPLQEGEMLVVPRGVEHRPVADAEVWVLLFEPAATVNTGTAGGALTVAKPDWI